MKENILYIIMDNIEPWFEYIFSQFSKINILKTNYKIITYAELDKHSKEQEEINNISLIEYGDKIRYPQSFFIPRILKFQTDKYIWLKEELPVFKDTIAANNKDYDIFYNAFVHLSRLEEWESENNGKLIYSYSSKHPRKEKKIWDIPVVNHLFDELEKQIKRQFPKVKFGPKRKPVIELSHDVDYLKKTFQLRIKQTIFNCLNLVKNFSNFFKFYENLRRIIKFFVKSQNYWHFDYWEEIEKKYNMRSIFYIYADYKKKILNHG